MTGLDNSLVALRLVLGSPRRHSGWRGLVRQRLTGVREELLLSHGLPDEVAHEADSPAQGAPLAARQHCLRRDRRRLLVRVDVLGAMVQHERDLDALVPDLHRLLAELERHRQRVADLVYDEVNLELGGSD